MNVNIHPPDPDSLLLAENQRSQGSKVQGAKLTAIWYLMAVLGCGSAWGHGHRFSPWVQKQAGLGSVMG